MKISCGTDIIEINRIKDSIINMGDNFINRVYTKKEIEYCETKRNVKYQHYAVRFAAKEAVYKAVSNLLKEKYGISWQNVEILNGEDGKPYVNFIGVNIDKIDNIEISLSHCKQYAVATVVIIYKEEK